MARNLSDKAIRQQDKQNPSLRSFFLIAQAIDEEYHYHYALFDLDTKTNLLLCSVGEVNSPLILLQL